MDNQKRSWVKVVERKGQSVLISSYFYNGIQTKYFQRLLGFPCGLDHYLIINDVNYYDQKEVEEFQRSLSSSLKKERWKVINECFDRLYHQANKLLLCAERINGLDVRDRERHSLPLFREFSEECLCFGPAMYFPILIEPLVEKEILRILLKHDAKAARDLFAILMRCQKPTEGSLELLNLYAIAEVYVQNNKTINQTVKTLIDDHLNRFGWLSYTKFAGDPWTRKTIRERIQSISKERVHEKYAELKTQYISYQRETKESVASLQLTKSELDLIFAAQELAYFRTYRLDVYTKAGFMVEGLFEVIAKKLGLSAKDLVFLTYEEIITSLQEEKRFPKAVIQKRKCPWQLLFSHGTMVFQYKEPFLIKLSSKPKELTVTGRIACKGHVRGFARIIRGVLEFSKMKNKDILITSMTTPDFVPLMERASAIITDEGGITSHAAIVSRELGVPCIIGTKVATQVFKDGDYVEVDAEKGIVRKINERSP